MDIALKCSAIIPTYNRVTLLRHTLDSLLRQSLPLDQFEVLVVDDGSSDSTATMVDDYRDRLNLRYFFQEDEGWRPAKARNVGIANARADVCVFVDSGTPGSLQDARNQHNSGVAALRRRYASLRTTDFDTGSTRPERRQE